MRLSTLPVLAATIVLALPAALSAQSAAPAADGARPPGCRGTSSNTSSVSLARQNAPPMEFPDYPEIEDVQSGSPAESGGMKPGDRLILQDGHDVVGHPPTKTYLAGDTVQFVVRRNDAEVPLTVVLGRWDPPQESPGVTRVCRPVEAPAGHE